MEYQEVIDALQEQLNQVEAQGSEHVQISALRAYLLAVKKDAGASQEFRKREHEGMLARYAANNQNEIEMLKAVLEAGKSALQSLIVINGGAVIALLGVMSNLAGKSGGVVLAQYLALPLLQFGIGVLSGAIGFAFRYFSQACYIESATEADTYYQWGNRFKYCAILSATAGYTLFGFAMVNAYNAMVWAFSI